MLEKTQIFEKIKDDFLKENGLEEQTAVPQKADKFNIGTIDLENEEIWLLQCPKGTKLSVLKDQKLKFPGRSHVNEQEVIATECDMKKQEAIGFTKQNDYSVRLLPVTGTILVRNSLKQNTSITHEAMEAASQHVVRAAIPKLIKVRHPLFGHTYKDKLNLSQSIRTALEAADQKSADITGRLRKRANVEGSGIKIKQEKVSPVSVKTKKRVHQTSPESVLGKRIKKEIKEEISDDLKWLESV